MNTPAPATKTHAPYRQIPLAKLITPDQPDRFLPGKEGIEELAASIAAHGLLQPILVAPGAAAGTFHLLAGHRRALACQQLGHSKIDARVLDISPDRSEAIRLTENIQREDLTPLEEAVAIKRMRDERNLTQEAAAELLGKGLSWLKKREALLRLPDDVMDALQANQVNASVALELGRIPDDGARSYYLQTAIQYGATQDVAGVWVTNFLREGAAAKPAELQEAAAAYAANPGGHQLGCHCCGRTFPVNQLRNALLCQPDYEAIAGATRAIPEPAPS